MSSAIGVFDSGIGGLSVLKALREHLPGENFIYLGDTARLPYGNKSPKTIAQYVQRNIDYLKTQKIKALVVACNSASSVLVRGGILASEDFDFPVYNVIDPAASEALTASKSSRIGILGTRATTSSLVYVDTLHRAKNDIEVFQQACPLFVPLVEEGWVDDPLTNLVIFRYLQPLLNCQVDTVILGCTHYPFLKPAITKVTGTDITLIDSAQAVAHQIKKDIRTGDLEATQNREGSWQVLTTDNNELFSHLAVRFMGGPSPSPMKQVDI